MRQGLPITLASSSASSTAAALSIFMGAAHASLEVLVLVEGVVVEVMMLVVEVMMLVEGEAVVI